MSGRGAYRRHRGVWRPSERQRAVLDLLAEGKTNAEIAVRLGISPDGAKWHVAELLSKTGLGDRQALAHWWAAEREERAALVPALLASWSLGVAASIAAIVLLAAMAWLLQEREPGEVAPATGERPGVGLDLPPTQTPEPAGSVWQRLAARPLELPALPVDATCPSSQPVPVGEGRALGPGPVHPVTGGEVLLGPFTYARSDDSWYAFKTLWVVAADYDGAVLVRGGRLDAQGELRFQRGDPATTTRAGSLRLPADETWAYGYGYGNGSRHFPSLTAVTSPGCYAWQVDGSGFSYHVVFSVQEPTRTAPDWSRADYLSRKGDLLLAVLDDSGGFVTIDLSDVAAFDCRTDCLLNAGPGLEPVRSGAELCIRHLDWSDGRQNGELWVGRSDCEEGGVN